VGNLRYYCSQKPQSKHILLLWNHHVLFIYFIISSKFRVPQKKDPTFQQKVL